MTASEKHTPVAPKGRKEQQRVIRFRATHRRFDWAPSPEALRVFELYRRRHPTMSATAILDRLVLLAHRAVTASGNG